MEEEKTNAIARRRLLAVVVTILIIFFILPSLGQGTQTSPQARRIDSKAGWQVKGHYVPGEVIVKFRAGISEKQRNEIKILAGVAKTIRKIGPKDRKDVELLKLKPDISVEQAVKRFKSRSEVLYVEPNYLRRIFFTPSDTNFSKQWGLHNTGQTIKGVPGTPDADIDAPEGWGTEKGQTNPVTVAVIDSGTDFTHPELDSRIWENSDEVSSNDIDDDLNGYKDDLNGYNWAGVSQTMYVGAWAFGYSSTYQIFAQSIKGTGQKLTHIGIMLQKKGSPTGSITVSVRSTLGGPDLASFTISPIEVSSSYESEIYKPLSSTITLTSGTTYYLLFQTTNNSPSNYYWLYDNWGDTTYDIYREGQEYRYVGGSSPWEGYPNDDFYFRTNPNPRSYDDNGHGTHVSGIIGAESDNSQGIAGVSFGAKIMSLKVGDSSGYISTADEIDALYYAAENGARVINMSFAGPDYSAAEENAINYAYGKGVALFAAVGNDGNATVNYPAGCTNVIGVGATTNQDQRASFSNYNSTVDLVAPGKYIYATMPTYPVALNSRGYAQVYDYLSGTSMATPYAVGLAALVFSQNPTYGPLQVEQAMKNSADDLGTVGRDNYFGYGRINAYKTLKDVAPPTVVSTIPPNSTTKVSVSANITATFSEDMDTSTINTSTFTLFQGATSITGTVSYDPATRTATFDPIANLSYGTTYTVTIKGGASGVKDLAGNPLATDYSWSFTTNYRPSADSITPTSGTALPGVERALTTTYSDQDGWQDIQEVRLLLNTKSSSTGGVQVRYNQNTNKLYLRNDTNTSWLGGYAPGTTNPDGSDKFIENSYAKLNVTDTSIAPSGNTLSVTWKLTFKDAFSGRKYNTYLYVKDDQGISNGGWQKRGTYTINYPPIVGTITPSSGSASAGIPQLFTATYMDTDSWQMIREAKLLINTLVSGSNAIYVYYNQNTNKLYLRNDANTAWLGGYSPGTTNLDGSDKFIENSYGKLNVTKTLPSGSGNILTIPWHITPKSTMSGKTYNTYLYAKDDAYATTGWKKKGTWGVL